MPIHGATFFRTHDILHQWQRMVSFVWELHDSQSATTARRGEWNSPPNCTGSTKNKALLVLARLKCALQHLEWFSLEVQCWFLQAPPSASLSHNISLLCSLCLFEWQCVCHCLFEVRFLSHHGRLRKSANVLECYVIFLPCSHLKESKADWHGKNAKKNDAGTQCRAIQKDDSYIGQHWERPRWAHIMTCSAHWHSQSCIVLPRRFSFLFSLAPVKIYMCDIFFWWEEEKQWKWQVWKHQDWKPSLHQTFLE